MPETLTLRARNRVRTRNDILDAAATLLGDAEPAVFRLEEVGQRAGVSRGTVYAHFPGGRDEIIREVYARAADRVRRRGETLRDDADDVADRIGALAQALVELASEPEGRFYGSVRPEVAAVVVDLLGSTSRLFGEFIREDLLAAERKGILDPWFDVDTLTTLIAGSIRAAGEASARHPGAQAALVATVRALVRRTLTAELH